MNAANRSRDASSTAHWDTSGPASSRPPTTPATELLSPCHQRPQDRQRRADGGRRRGHRTVKQRKLLASRLSSASTVSARRLVLVGTLAASLKGVDGAVIRAALRSRSPG